jgi:hypothetical protein
MSDIVKYIAVLKRNIDPTRNDELWVRCGEEDHVLICKEGVKPVGHNPSWRYDVRGTSLHVAPSLWCPLNGFHTANSWDVEFVLCPVGVYGQTHLRKVNGLEEL